MNRIGNEPRAERFVQLNAFLHTIPESDIAITVKPQRVVESGSCRPVVIAVIETGCERSGAVEQSFAGSAIDLQGGG